MVIRIFATKSVRLLVMDRMTKMQLFSGSDLFAGHMGLRSLSPRNGKDIWLYMGKVDVYDVEPLDGKFFFAVAEEAPSGRWHPVCNFKVQHIGAK